MLPCLEAALELHGEARVIASIELASDLDEIVGFGIGGDRHDVLLAAGRGNQEAGRERQSNTDL